MLIHAVELFIMLEVSVVFLIKWRERNMDDRDLLYIHSHFGNDVSQARSFKRSEMVLVYIFSILFVWIYVINYLTEYFAIYIF
jgi:hypothetical protein